MRTPPSPTIRRRLLFLDRKTKVLSFGGVYQSQNHLVGNVFNRKIRYFHPFGVPSTLIECRRWYILRIGYKFGLNILCLDLCRNSICHSGRAFLLRECVNRIERICNPSVLRPSVRIGRRSSLCRKAEREK